MSQLKPSVLCGAQPIRRCVARLSPGAPRVWRPQNRKGAPTSRPTSARSANHRMSGSLADSASKTTPVAASRRVVKVCVNGIAVGVRRAVRTTGPPGCRR
jgi:hypothetical protein